MIWIPAKPKTECINGVVCKKCSGRGGCDKIKPLIEFTKRGGTYSNGDIAYRSICIECQRIIDKKRYNDSIKGNRLRTRINKWRREIRIDPIKGKIIKEKDKERKIIYLKNPIILEKTRLRTRENQRKKREDPIENQKMNTRRREARKLQPDKYKIIDANQRSARRGFGYKPKNIPSSLNNVFHHLGTDHLGNHDPDIGVWIPEKIHGAGHSVYAERTKKHGYGMITKNSQIYEWYKRTYPNDTTTIELLKQISEATKERVINGWENAPGWVEWLEYKKILNTKIR